MTLLPIGWGVLTAVVLTNALPVAVGGHAVQGPPQPAPLTVYWTDRAAGGVFRSDLSRLDDPQAHWRLPAAQTGSPDDVVAESALGDVFATSITNRSIQRWDVYGCAGRDVGERDGPFAPIAVDPTTLRLVWVENGRIVSTRFDGTDRRESAIQVPAWWGPHFPNRIAIDPTSGRLYVTCIVMNSPEFLDAVVYSVAPDGSGFEELWHEDATEGHSPAAIAIDGQAGLVYFVDRNAQSQASRIMRVPVGGGAATVWREGGDVRGVAVTEGGAAGSIVVWAEPARICWSGGSRESCITPVGPGGAWVASDIADIAVQTAPDTDGDGLLDSWELVGIPLGDDPANVYVLEGADPRRKDLYVEMDLMLGQSFPDAAVQALVRAFDKAPVDGGLGVALHITVDDQDLGHQTFAVGSPAWDGFMADFYVYKNLRFGTSEERDLEFHGRPGLLDAKRRAFRYCLGIDRHIDRELGRAEIYGNDFYVCLGELSALCGDGCVDWEYKAATFMHELGHNLGLDHGGTDDINLKPNFISVMNNLWTRPARWNRSWWSLDYSREAIGAPGSDLFLHEGALNETVGVETSTYRWFPARFYNGPVLPSGYVSDDGGDLRTWFLRPHWIDWNSSGSDDGLLKKPALLRYRGPGSNIATARSPAPEILLGAEDWSRLMYPIRCGDCDQEPGCRAPDTPPGPVAANEITVAMHHELAAQDEQCQWRWVRVSDSGPSPRMYASMAYHEGLGRTVLYGGASQSGAQLVPNDDTWIWTGAGWTRLEVAGPPARSHAGVAYDADRGVLVLHGGANPATGAFYFDTWEFDGIGWRLSHPDDPSLATAATPTLVHDPAHSRTLLSFGYPNWAALVWEWADGGWRSLGASPPWRQYCPAVFDAAREQAVAYGGLTEQGYSDQTLVWDGAAWSPVEPRTLESPGPRAFHAMAYDPRIQLAIVLGGRAMDGGPRRGDTWAWNGQFWSLLVPESADIAPRVGAVMAFDHATNELLLFGGSSDLGMDGATYALRCVHICRPDLNGNGLLDVGDFAAFRNAYLAGDMVADFSGNGALEVGDFTAFRSAYLAGCP